MKRVSAIVFTMGLFAAGTALSQDRAGQAGNAEAMPEPERSAMIASCAVCHGPLGEGNEARSAPRLAGLDADYVQRQLDLFAAGRRGTAPNDTFGSQMYMIAQSLQPADRKVAASHYAKMIAPSPPRTLCHMVSGQSGKQAYETCAACHGEDGMGNQSIGAPRIAGQADWYILASLEAYQSGARGYNKDDIAGQQMKLALEGVDQSSFEAIAAYASSLGNDE